MSNQSIFDLTGKVAVVTGGNGGLGLGMALVCESSRSAEVLSLAPGARVVGEVVEAVDERRVIL